MKKIIQQGAEAILYVEDGKLIKERIKKGYRIKEIDDSLRKLRTRKETKLLEKAKIIDVPEVYDSSDKNMKIVMEYLRGDLIKDILDGIDSGKRKSICKNIGKNISVLHEKDIIHGDLTTSNMILRKNKVYFIDFGLGFISDKVEDKAVDLHLLKKALMAKHYRISEEVFENVLEGYKENKSFKEVLNRLEKVESRGRYKRKGK